MSEHYGVHHARITFPK